MHFQRQWAGWLARYLLMITPPLAGIFVILQLGSGLRPAQGPASTASIPSPASGTAASSAFNLLILLAQVVVILAVARMIGALFRRLGQPRVVGEMAAGILLGPSFFGWVAPGGFSYLFSAASLGFLNALSQIGLVVFMFLVGLHLDLDRLRGQAHSAVATSHVSILAPFCLGALLALYLYPRLGTSPVPFTNFALFLGVSLSITAFPVLARLLQERDMLRTRVGTVTITCAAVDDATAWCILAGVVIIARASTTSLPFWATLIGVPLYLLVMLILLRPALNWLMGVDSRSEPGTDQLAILLLLALGSAWTTEALGIHALFGAFLAGAVLPRNRTLNQAIIARMEPLTVVLLLPLFFAFTGLRTSIGLISDSGSWFYLLAITAVAFAGKIGGAFFSSRLSGLSWREAGAVGVLMNTRGLVELVALNIGLDIGVISPTVFTILVLMALFSTVITSPLLQLLYPRRLWVEADKSAFVPAAIEAGEV